MSSTRVNVTPGPMELRCPIVELGCLVEDNTCGLTDGDGLTNVDGRLVVVVVVVEVVGLIIVFGRSMGRFVDGFTGL